MGGRIKWKQYGVKKRAQSGLTRADMAKELGVEYNKYKAMERGEIKMPSKLMDKFNEIINKGKTN